MKRHKLSRATRVLPIAIAPLGLLGWLHRYVTSTSTDVEQAITIAMWWVAVALAVWTAASVVFWAAVEACGHPQSAWFGRITVPGSRLLATTALATTALVVSACSSGTQAPVLRAVAADTVTTAAAPTTTTSSLPDDPPRSEFALDEPALDEPALDEPTGLDATSPQSFDDQRDIVEPPPLEVGIDPHPLARSSAAEYQTPLEHEVEQGESLWSIAQSHRTEANPEATATDVANYWRALIDANAAKLRSGQPNLIYVGEVLTLPVIAGG